MKRTTNKQDKHGKEIFEGDKLRGKTFDGHVVIFIVKWSNYHNRFIGDCRDEIYDINPSIFHQYEITNDDCIEGVFNDVRYLE